MTLMSRQPMANNPDTFMSPGVERDRVRLAAVGASAAHATTNRRRRADGDPTGRRGVFADHEVMLAASGIPELARIPHLHHHFRGLLSRFIYKIQYLKIAIAVKPWRIRWVN